MDITITSTKLTISNIIVLFLFVNSLIAANSLAQPISTENTVTSAITYHVNSCGRLGDKLALYAKTKILAHKFNLPLLYQPFEYSDQLAMHVKEKHFDANSKNQFKQIVPIKDKKVDISRDSGTLYIVDYWCDFNEMYGIDFWFAGIKSYNTELLQEIKEMISPLTPTEAVPRPHDRISVAVHARRGGGYDKTSFNAGENTVRPWRADLNFTRMKFPETQYYINQLRDLYEMLGHKPLYVHIFTDDSNPQKVITEFQDSLKDLPITFGTRLVGNAYNANVLDDLFAMATFDCLIRADSSFSYMAGQLGNHLITIQPVECHLEGKCIVVDKIHINTSDTFKTQQEKH